MRTLAVFGFLLLLVACHSTVRTETRYLPPTAPEQLACVDACYKSDQSCMAAPASEPPAGAPAPSEAEAEAARRDYDECSKRVQAEYEQCQAGARTSSGKSGNCYRPVCVVNGNLTVSPAAAKPEGGDNDSAACTRIFNACFVSCGGRIQSRQRCEGSC